MYPFNCSRPLILHFYTLYAFTSLFCIYPDAKVLRPSQTRTQCCGHIVADTNARARNIRCGHKFCVRDTKNVSDFVQKHFVSATNVSQFAQPKKHHGQQCVRNNVSSFTRAFIFTFKLDNLPLVFTSHCVPFRFT